MSNGLINTVERVDDILLLLAQMKKIQLATFQNKILVLLGLSPTWQYQELLQHFTDVCWHEQAAAYATALSSHHFKELYI